MKGDLSIGGTPFANDAVTTVVQVKASYGTITGMKLVNTTGVAAYLQLFFKPSASIVLGTTVPDWFFRMAANESTQWIQFYYLLGVPSGTGISIAGTTTSGGSTTAAVSAMMLYL